MAVSDSGIARGCCAKKCGLSRARKIESLSKVDQARREFCLPLYHCIFRY
jgi:hypothetical protein